MALAASEISSYNCPKVSYISPKKVDDREFFMFEYELRNGCKRLKKFCQNMASSSNSSPSKESGTCTRHNRRQMKSSHHKTVKMILINIKLIFIERDGIMDKHK